jgi:arylsulfatase A-like enzyme
MARLAGGALAALVAAAASSTVAAAPPTRPNIVFLHGESTDGRLFRPGSPVPLPNIRGLMASGGVTFDMTYSNAPVCCPSRASMLTGRYPHRVGHPHNGLFVKGVYNNYEGLTADNATVFDMLAASGYAVRIEGKTDWENGGHTESAMLEALTHNVAFPYNVSRDGGWSQEDVCASNGTVIAGGSGGAAGSAYPTEWKTVEGNTAWIASRASNSTPFLVYQGFNIIHPPYATSEYWFNKINASDVTVPVWPALDDMHPCDLQQSMLKGCLPADDDAAAFDDPARIRRIRTIYYAMVAEWDAMVGAYVAAVRDAGLLDNTVFVVDADHGDMQLLRRQFYKMVQFEASAHVPLLIAGPGIATQVVPQPTQLLDIFPTLLDLAGLPVPADTDGYSLLPFLSGESVDPSRPTSVISQFHGDDISMSWFMAVEGTPPSPAGGDGEDGGAAGAWTYVKYVNFGLGNHSDVGVVPQLFNLTADPEETTNLWTSSDPTAARLESLLLKTIDYPTVAADVAAYQQDMFRWWMGANPTTWQKQLSDPTVVRWAQAWEDAGPNASLAAVEAWLAAPRGFILPCRNATVWPAAA